ncbi:hypothetical protein L9F63_020626 [Diploptera punctata]|uniref:Triokinase/FMN cyclase n=1 Tax=Diploptera punctata TaxID=6984 RepID=A0AAD7ZQK4_DIPPU|nr:hypothetical protein L9F63_020626 [Diploptera punctata]
MLVSAGALVYIANYTGDCLNFGLAVEWAKTEGLKVESVVLGEDCALLGTDGSVGRRGMADVEGILKLITGELAEQGKSLSELVATSKKLLSCLATYGVGLTACSVPGSGPLFKIGDDEMELGLGVHGEAGIKRVKFESINVGTETVQWMLKSIIKTLNLGSGDDVVVLINNLGGSSQLEQWLVAGEVHKQLFDFFVTLPETFEPHIMTSFEMAGIQVSVLNITGPDKAEWLRCLDAKTDAPAWPGSPLSVQTCLKEAPPPVDMGASLSSEECEKLKKCLEAVAKALILNVNKLNELDSTCGDGDTGTTLQRVGQAVLQDLEELPLANPFNLFKKLSSLAEESMGGTSGALYSLLLAKAGMVFEAENQVIDANTWGRALRGAISGTLYYSTAKPGDRTMFDALLPACEEFESHKISTNQEALTALEAAVKAAKQGCEKTCRMKARLGRASYVDPKLVKDVDAGAYAVTVWLEALYNELIS